MRKLAREFGWTRLFALILLLAITQIRALGFAPLEGLQLRTFDFYQWLAPRQHGDHQVMIVDIDERSLEEYGQFPWSRTRMASLIDAIARNGGLIVGMDMVFPEPDRLNPHALADTLPRLNAETRKTLRQIPSNDQVFAEAMTRVPVVVGQSGTYGKPKSNLQEAHPQTSFAVMGDAPQDHVAPNPPFKDIVRNIPPLEQAAAGRGLFNIEAEFGGTVRRVPLVQNVAGTLMPSLTLDVLRVALGGETILVKSNDLGVEGVFIEDTLIPTDERGSFWVHFAPSDPAQYVSAVDVIENKPAATALNGKIVLIGPSAAGLNDLVATPVQPAIPGVEVHAQLLENILAGTSLVRPIYAVGGEVVLTLVIGLAIIILVPVLGALRVLVLGLVAAVAIAFLSWHAYKEYGLLLDATYPLLSISSVFFALLFINYFREEKGRNRVRNAFGQYLAPALVEKLADDPDQLVLGGETRNLTLLFSDIRNFTSLSETYMHDPQGLISLTNRILTPLSNAILDQRGTIDKYIGDAIVAFWNAPLEDADHPDHACAAALNMLDQLKRINGELSDAAEDENSTHSLLKVGIGINTGDCVVGNIGSDLRFDYSVLGDTVNVASRLEGATTVYGTPIILGEATARRLNPKFATLEIDTIRVQGKVEPTNIYTLLGVLEEGNSQAFKALSDAFSKMRDAYRKADWETADNALDTCRGMAENAWDLEDLFDTYADRIKTFRHSPPPPGWNGVTTMQRK